MPARDDVLSIVKGWLQRDIFWMVWEGMEGWLLSIVAWYVRMG
jgi:hypothetical protein